MALNFMKYNILCLHKVLTELMKYFYRYALDFWGSCVPVKHPATESTEIWDLFFFFMELVLERALQP